MLPGGAARLRLPGALALHGDGRARLRSALQVAFDVLCVVALGIAVGGAVIAGELAQALGGDAFRAAEGPLRILLCARSAGQRAAR